MLNFLRKHVIKGERTALAIWIVVQTGDGCSSKVKIEKL